MPLSEILDRHSILRLKKERLTDRQKDAEFLLDQELAAYNRAIQEFTDRGVAVKADWRDELYRINGGIWDLEADIRQGKEAMLGLEEVGRRAILIRDWNKKRIAVKNLIAKETGSGFIEVKINHASQ